jgi:hypothetical protein
MKQSTLCLHLTNCDRGILLSITYTQYLYDRYVSLCTDQGRLLRHHDWRPTSFDFNRSVIPLYTQLLRPRSSSVDRSTFNDAMYSITPTDIVLIPIPIPFPIPIPNTNSKYQFQIRSTLLCRPGQYYTIPNSRQNYTMPNSNISRLLCRPGPNYVLSNTGSVTNTSRLLLPIITAFDVAWIRTWLRCVKPGQTNVMSNTDSK